MSERLTDEQLREIEARYKASTEGVWYWGEGNSTVLCNAGIVTATKNIFVNCGRSSGEPSDEDRDFLANAHQDIPALLAEIRELRAERDRILDQSEELISRALPRLEALESGNKRDLDLARKTAALEALKLVGESMQMYWELPNDHPNADAARYNRARAHEASSLQDQIIRHFKLPPTARIEVDDDKRPVPPNLLENAS